MLPIEVVGSSYSGPPTSPVLTFTNGVAGFYAGDLFTGDSATWDWVKVVFSPPASFRAEAGAEKVRLTVNKKTGVLSGSFIDIATGLKTPVRGVVLQQQDVAEGFFLSTSHSGMFSLVPGTPVH